MKKLKFKNRDGILYFGAGKIWRSSKLKYTSINKNILQGRFNRGELDSELGIESNYNVPTVTKLLEDVISSKAKVLKHKSMLAYRMTCKTHIIPYFKEKYVTQVKPIDIKKFQDSLVEKGLKKQTLVFARVLLKETLN